MTEVILRYPHERQRRRLPKVDQRVTPEERGILALLSVLMGGLPLLYSLTRWLDFANYRLLRGTRLGMGGLGTVLLGGAVWLFWRSHRDLGSNWSPSLEISAQQTLVTQGVYRRVRHPMYGSQLLWGLAQALLLQNWLAGPGGLVSFLALYWVRVPHEEGLMLDHFGDAYRSYMARTGRILPPVPSSPGG